jgi:hypothetical protein
VAIAPERPVALGSLERVGWWLVDPISGRAWDRLDDERGSVGLQYQVTLTPGQLARETAMKKLARDCIAATAIVFGTFIAGAVLGTGLAHGNAWLAAAGGLAGGAGLAGIGGPGGRCHGAAFP